ncbi:hypothetical protein [Streptomyces ossamyceticus]|uniref:hypothetical protein n=1 Tax=Streptomyces ossamyceticus TaxID=249581 RepID=UPI0012FF1913|nr:hypothetical protein [Streptomyces ossamyceticus]
MEIATVRRTLNHTLTELQRAIDHHAVAEAADLYALAWQQAAQAPPSETREQRARLASYKEILGSSRWRDEERRQARDASPKAAPRPEQRAAPRPRPGAEPAPTRPAVAWSSSPEPPATTTPERRPAAQAAPGSRPRTAEPALLDAGRLWEIATELRPLLEQTARDGATTNWPAIRKRLPGLPRLHRDDESVILWLVDEDRQDGEPLLSALVTVGNRQMHPRFPAIAEQLGLATGRATAQQRTAWSYEVLKVHQHWRYRH